MIFAALCGQASETGGAGPACLFTGEFLSFLHPGTPTSTCTSLPYTNRVGAASHQLMDFFKLSFYYNAHGELLGGQVRLALALAYCLFWHDPTTRGQLA